MPKTLMPTVLEGHKKQGPSTESTNSALQGWGPPEKVVDGIAELLEEIKGFPFKFRDDTNFSSVKDPKFFDDRDASLEDMVPWLDALSAAVVTANLTKFLEHSKAESIDPGGIIVRLAPLDSWLSKKREQSPKERLLVTIEDQYQAVQELISGFNSFTEMSDEFQRSGSDYNAVNLLFATVDLVDAYAHTSLEGKEPYPKLKKYLSGLKEQVQEVVQQHYDRVDSSATEESCINTFIKLENRIRELENELENTWFFHPHRSRKQNKINLLRQIVEKYNLFASIYSPSEAMGHAVDMVKAEKKNKAIIGDLTAGVFSSRTAKLLKELMAEERAANKLELTFSCMSRDLI